jgi:hypothetical protein
MFSSHICNSGGSILSRLPHWKSVPYFTVSTSSVRGTPSPSSARCDPSSARCVGLLHRLQLVSGSRFTACVGLLHRLQLVATRLQLVFNPSNNIKIVSCNYYKIFLNNKEIAIICNYYYSNNMHIHNMRKILSSIIVLMPIHELY